MVGKLKEVLLYPAVPCRKQTQGSPGANELPLTVIAGSIEKFSQLQLSYGDVRMAVPTEAVMTMPQKRERDTPYHGMCGNTVHHGLTDA